MLKRFKIDSFGLKLIAMLTMVIDHVGFFFFPNILLFRIIGRISFPLFAFLICEGIRYTKHPYRYIGTLLTLGILMDVIIFAVANLYIGNVFTTLGLGGLLLYLLKLPNQKKFFALLPGSFLLLANFPFFGFQTDYGAYALFLFLGFFGSFQVAKWYGKRTCLALDIDVETFYKENHFTKLYVTVSAVFFVIFHALLYLFTPMIEAYLPSTYISLSFQSYAILCLPFLFFYSGKRGYDSKPFRIFSYLFYPLHFVIFMLIAFFLL